MKSAQPRTTSQQCRSNLETWSELVLNATSGQWTMWSQLQNQKWSKSEWSPWTQLENSETYSEMETARPSTEQYMGSRQNTTENLTQQFCWTSWTTCKIWTRIGLSRHPLPWPLLPFALSLWDSAFGKSVADTRNTQIQFHWHPCCQSSYHNLRSLQWPLPYWSKSPLLTIGLKRTAPPSQSTSPSPKKHQKNILLKNPKEGEIYQERNIWKSCKNLIRPDAKHYLELCLIKLVPSTFCK